MVQNQKSSELDVLVIGAGVVGLAAGVELAQSGLSTIVVERHRCFGFETSSRNSEVMHAGLYYKPGSLKAKLCRSGLSRLYAYCDSRRIAYSRIGKLVVASGQAAETKLNDLAATAHANGVEGLSWLDGKEVSHIEPNVSCDIALHSRDTGIIDSHGLMSALVADLAEAGGIIAFDNIIKMVELGERIHKVWIIGDEQPLRVRRIVNAAGLHAVSLAKTFKGLSECHVPKEYFARGCYFRLADNGRPFGQLVYPLPDNASLGIHATVDLQGNVRFGPDVEWIESAEDYFVAPGRAAAFYNAIAAYYPDIMTKTLVADYAGIRPKLNGPGEPPADFRIDGDERHGVKGLVNLFGIESPGLTSSLAIAKSVRDLLA